MNRQDLIVKMSSVLLEDANTMHENYALLMYVVELTLINMEELNREANAGSQGGS